MDMRRVLRGCAVSLRPAVVLAAVWITATTSGYAGSASVCPRFSAGNVVSQPQDLFSSHGVLRVHFTYETTVDEYGNTLFCFMTESRVESPTLHVRPGDRLVIDVKNNVPAAAPSTTLVAMRGMMVSGSPSPICGALTMTPSSVNIHYHGTNTPPTCHQDEVIHTLINSGESFQYDVQFPTNEPPGLYWYHPHVHGLSEMAVQGGASGAIVVEGIENFNPAVAGLPQQILILRDNIVPGKPNPRGKVPTWDLSLNYIPVAYPAFTPAIIPMKPGEKQFWRVLNSAANTMIDLQLQYDGVPQALEIVALDGVPVGSQNGVSRGTSFQETHILLGPAARAEFIVTGPSAAVRDATLMTLKVETGPDGDNDPTRPIAAIQASANAPEPPLTIPSKVAPPRVQRFAGLNREKPAINRLLYFSEVLSDPHDPDSPTDFYITVEGQTPRLFSANNPPAIVTTQGSVEDWVIENRSMETHDFHIHQIHFLLLERNGVPVSNGQFLDTVQIPYWRGTGPYPSIKVRMDFRGQVVGDFVYHCHMLNHEDKGMMAVIRVLPATVAQGRR
jgi:FtsP/CotA-like multicopper oxidase with cupredoxin domain